MPASLKHALPGGKVDDVEPINTEYSPVVVAIPGVLSHGARGPKLGLGAVVTILRPQAIHEGLQEAVHFPLIGLHDVAVEFAHPAPFEHGR